jgi:hypothetical protein
MIVVSRTAQAVNRKQRVEELEPQAASHLPRHASLNVRGVDSRDALDEHHRKTDPGEKKGAILQREAPGGDGSRVPQTPCAHERHRKSSRHQRDQRVAGRMHRRGEEEAQESTCRLEDATKLLGVISEDGAISHP